MGTVFLRRLSRWQAETEREAIGDTYVEGHRDAPGTRALEREAFVRRFVDEDLRQQDFDMMVASDPAPAGFAYGFRADRDGSWWETFTGVPNEIDELTGARQVFVVAQLLVAPRRRRQGVATRLHKELLGRSGAALFLALLQPGNAPARTAFQTWGWSKAGQLTPRDGAEAPLEAWARTKS
ncbi:GNAT family N-acetyltransferase [Streptomyces litchfieldiae]|uniref:GNAT family N-acetyltransferase n=1 Tax=Streptomyces litchfieldiae TaxID=3075543 RepID=A0ABU2MLV0_9ACTN|nr:GNAT family N-acetyltransferase [Streptomyces sp. DSM 44938]MDT0341619.1 GNAT family N-acetyltransferase [Streptomyces sp. DSM 44938]